MAAKQTALTQEQFDRLNASGWTANEVPREHWDKIPGLQRLHDTLAVMASGCPMAPQTLNGIMAVAGIDVLTRETRPKPGEPEGNAYHYVVQKITDSRFPYLLNGPYRAQTVVDHWFGADQLVRYWQTTDEEPDAPTDGQ